MNFSDVLGLVITLFVLLYTVFKKVGKERQIREEIKETHFPGQHQKPIEEKKNEHRAVHKVESHPLPPVKKIKKKPLDVVKHDAYDILWMENQSKVKMLLKEMPSKKNMIIIQEVLGPPKAFRQP